MEIGILKKETVSQTPRRGKVVIAANLIREKVMLDSEGNEVNFRTKQIIKKNTEQ